MVTRSAGVYLPLFALRSKKDLGSGEFLDLLPLIDWCESAGLKVIQLLPIYDTGIQDPNPFSASSSFFLHPNYLNLQSMAPEFELIFKPIAKALNLPHLDYKQTYRAKQELLEMLFEIRGEDDLSSKAFAKFFKSNEEDLKDSPPFDRFVQFHLYEQLEQAIDYADERGIVLNWADGGELLADRDPRDFPIQSTCTPSNYDEAPLRAWWEEDEDKRAHYYHTVLQRTGNPPESLTADLAHQIIQSFMSCKAKTAVFLLQDLFALDDGLKIPYPE